MSNENGLTEVVEEVTQPDAAAKVTVDKPSKPKAADPSEVILFIESGKAPRQVKLREIKRMLADIDSKERVNPYWFDIQNPSEKSMQTLAKLLDIHPLTVEDCIVAKESSRQKLEVYKHYRFLKFTEVHYLPGSNVLNSVDINIIVFSRVVLSLHNGRSHCINTAAKRVQEKKEGYLSADWIMYAILDAICDAFFNLVEGLVQEIRALDQMVLTLNAGEQNDLLSRVGLARKQVVFLRTQMSKKRDIVQSLVLSDTAMAAELNIYTIPLDKSIKVYLRDVLDHIYTMLDAIDNSKESLSILSSTYLARVSIEVAVASNDMNAVMKKLNAVTVIFLPLGVVAGLWGMNVPVPGQHLDPGVEEAPPIWWFLGIVAGMIVFTIVAVIIFKRLKWF